MRSFLVCFSCLLLSNMSFAQKARDYTDVVAELIQHLQPAAMNDKPMRLAIVPFTTSSDIDQNRFGEYLTESITGKLLERPHQFKVFERSRMDAILKENELMLSGLMKPSEAIKIGQLLPIDALFSGTYTKLKSYIDVSGRLIDVESGEILVSYSGRVKMNKNLKTLFENSEADATSGNGATTSATQNNMTNINVSVAAPGPSPEELCRARQKSIKAELDALSDADQAGAVIDEALAIPFDNDCGRIHYEVMSHFRRYKIFYPTYYTFLLETLEGIPHPSKDDRAVAIAEYFKAEDGINEWEWRTILETLCRMEYGHYSMIAVVFEGVDVEEGRFWIRNYFHSLESGKLGSPEPLPYNVAFFAMMNGLGNKNHALQLYTYENFGSKLTLEAPTSISNHMLYLGRMYENESDPAFKSKIIQWVANYFAKYAYEKSAKQLFEFARKFDPEVPQEWNKASVEEANREKTIKYPLHDLHALIDACRDKFSAYALDTRYASEREDRINFCLKYGIEVPGAIPTMEEARQILAANNLDEQVRVMKLLVQMGNKPKVLERELIALLDRRSLEDKEKLTEVQNYSLEILGNIGTSQARAIDHMISRLMSFNYKESDNSQKALVAIGKPSVDPLIAKLKSTTIHDGGLRYKLVVILGKIGKDAKPAEPVLRKILQENKNADIQYAIEAALQSIGS